MDDIDKAAAAIARDHGLPVPIVLGIMDIESGGHEDAQRFEPGYRWLVDVDSHQPFRKLTTAEANSLRAPKDFDHYQDTTADTEWIGQKTSWGPMQIMGATAREQGFALPWFSALCGPMGIHYGCLYLKTLRQRFDHEDWPGIVSAYNQGSPKRGADGEFNNRGYVMNVMVAADSWAS